MKVVGEVKDFDPHEWLKSKKLAVRTDRNTHFAFAACAEALDDAGLDLEDEDSERVGLVMSSNYGGLSYFLDNLVRLHQQGPSFVSAYMAIAWIPSAPVGQLSIMYGIHGYAKTIVNDAAGGTDAIGAAYRAIRRGDADVIIAGGFEAAIAEAAIAGLAGFDEVCRDADDPATAFRPFDQRALRDRGRRGRRDRGPRGDASARRRAARRSTARWSGSRRPPTRSTSTASTPTGTQYARAMQAGARAGRPLERRRRAT